MKISFIHWFWLLAVTSIALFLFSLFMPSTLGGPNTGSGFLLQELFTVDADIARIILIELRIPRACLAMLVGASLGLAGAAMQGLLRNPLAEPGVVGVSGTAALGATLTFYTGLASVAPLA